MKRLLSSPSRVTMCLLITFSLTCEGRNRGMLSLVLREPCVEIEWYAISNQRTTGTFKKSKRSVRTAKGATSVCYLSIDGILHISVAEGQQIRYAVRLSCGSDIEW